MKKQKYHVPKITEGTMKWILPQEYVDCHLGKGIDGDYLLIFLQNDLREALQSFLNGGFSKAGFAFYPLIQDVSLENRQRLERLRRVARNLHKRGEGFSLSSSYQQSLSTSSSCARFICLLCKDFAACRKTKTKEARKKPCDPFRMDDYRKEDQDYLSPLERLQSYAGKTLKNDMMGFYLHGSLATNDFIRGWSDCDTLLVLRQRSLQDPKNLLLLREKIFGMRGYFFQIDPLQHHGCMIASEHDVDRYSDAYFPFPLFSYAKALSPDAIDTISRREMGPEKYEKLYWFVRYFREMKEMGTQTLSSYEAKNLLHLIALFPSLYLQAKNVIVYKKFSFEIARKDFPKEMWGPIRTMTHIRRFWKGFPKSSVIDAASRINPIAAYQMNALLGDILFGMRKKNQFPIKKLVSGMHELSEEAWEKIARTVGRT